MNVSNVYGSDEYLIEVAALANYLQVYYNTVHKPIANSFTLLRPLPTQGNGLETSSAYIGNAQVPFGLERQKRA